MKSNNSVSDFLGDALDGILATHLYFRQNSYTILQSAVILIIPPAAIFLVSQYSDFGIKLGIEPSSFPLIVIILFVSSLYLMLEGKSHKRHKGDLIKFFLTSVSIFTIAMLFATIYSSSLVIMYGKNPPNILADNIQNAIFTERPFNHLEFALFYSSPFVISSIILISINSFIRYPWRTRILIRSMFFWRTTIAVSVIAFYQFITFIIMGTVISIVD